jgi:hypothetical protein
MKLVNLMIIHKPKIPVLKLHYLLENQLAYKNKSKIQRKMNSTEYPIDVSTEIAEELIQFIEAVSLVSGINCRAQLKDECYPDQALTV